MKFFSRRRQKLMQVVEQTPTEAAVHWLARSQLDLLRRDERAAFQHWQQEPQNAAALAQLTAVMGQVQDAASQPSISQMRSEALSRQRKTPLLLGHVPVGIAAGIMVAIWSILFVWRESLHQEPSVASVSGASQAVVANQVYQTRKGERRVIKLADGSRLTLNTGSRAEVALSTQYRTVRLVQGQGLFQVARDQERPFTVIAGSVRVQALGTQFDVKLEHEQAKVVLIEGRVSVEPLTRRGMARLLPIMDRHYLNPGEQLIAKDEEHISVAVADVERSTSWQHDRLVFRDDTLASAIAELNRYSTRQIVIGDRAITQFPVSGVFAISRPENFLAAVSTFYSLQLEEHSPQLAVLTQRKR